jgi:hypothetical protein
MVLFQKIEMLFHYILKALHNKQTNKRTKQVKQASQKAEHKPKSRTQAKKPNTSQKAEPKPNIN